MSRTDREERKIIDEVHEIVSEMEHYEVIGHLNRYTDSMFENEKTGAVLNDLGEIEVTTLLAEADKRGLITLH